MKENRRNRFKHIAASIVLLFCMVMSIGMICFADEQGTVIVESARIRAAADQNSEQLGSVAKGKTVDIIGQTTGTDKQVWYQVYVDANTKGYIRANLIKLKDGASLKTVDGGKFCGDRYRCAARHRYRYQKSSSDQQGKYPQRSLRRQ